MGRIALTPQGVSTEEQRMSSARLGNHPDESYLVPGSSELKEPDPDAGRCIQLKLDGGRCRGKAIPGKQGMCMVHCERVADEAE